MHTPWPVLATLLLAYGCGSPKNTEETGGTTTAEPSTGGPGSSTSQPTTDPVPTTSGEGTSTGATTAATTAATTGASDDTSTGEPVCGPGAFTPLGAVLEQARQDLLALPLQTRSFTRYISLVHLHNAGLCESDIAPARRALGKLLNALSSDPTIKLPVEIDGDGLLLRIDLRDYGWQDPVVAEDLQMFADTWEMVARTNLHAIEHIGEAAADLEAVSGTKFVLLPADALVVAASLPPLYYDALRLPGELAPLAQQLGVDLEAQIDDEFTDDPGVVARAAIHVSDTTLLHRVVERHELPNAANRALWRTHDFNSEVGPQNIFVHPLDFDSDVSEVLFTLPNGLHGYMIVDAKGERLHEMPVQIEQGSLLDDQVIRAGLSCMNCHSSGLIKANDDLRFELDNGRGGEPFDDVTLDHIRKLYPPRPEMDALMEADIQSYSAASALAGAPVGDEEPISATFFAFTAPVDLTRAAAELWLPAAELQANLGELGPDLAALADGTVTREVFSAHFAESVCLLELGKTTACP